MYGCPRKHKHTRTHRPRNHHASSLQMKPFKDHLQRCFPIRDAPVHDEYVHSELCWELCSRASLPDIFVWLCGIDFPIQQQKDINVYYYNSVSFPFTICIFAQQFQFTSNKWSSWIASGGVNRCICSFFSTLGIYWILQMLFVEIKVSVWPTWWGPVGGAQTTAYMSCKLLIFHYKYSPNKTKCVNKWMDGEQRRKMWNKFLGLVKDNKVWSARIKLC